MSSSKTGNYAILSCYTHRPLMKTITNFFFVLLFFLQLFCLCAGGRAGCVQVIRERERESMALRAYKRGAAERAEPLSYSSLRKETRNKYIANEHRPYRRTAAPPPRRGKTGRPVRFAKIHIFKYFSHAPAIAPSRSLATYYYYYYIVYIPSTNAPIIAHLYCI